MHFPAKLDQLCTSLKLPVLKDIEIAFVNEDVEVFSHLAEGIDRLQGDLNAEIYMGFSTLLQLQHIYEQLSNSSKFETLHANGICDSGRHQNAL